MVVSFHLFISSVPQKNFIIFYLTFFSHTLFHCLITRNLLVIVFFHILNGRVFMKSSSLFLQIYKEINYFVLLQKISYSFLSEFFFTSKKFDFIICADII